MIVIVYLDFWEPGEFCQKIYRYKNQRMNAQMEVLNIQKKKKEEKKML